ncbi:MAG: ABC transporter ATP-binding protein [Lachnospiraceae bacterium]|nr:ABC transporter ATP-binding protein [Lachnospiraceae bacterium]
MEQKTLEVNHLCVSFFTQKGEVKAVNDVSLEVPAGKIVGIVGESGCGKSMTARAVMGLIKHPGKITGGSILLSGREMTTLSKKELCAMRGQEVSMVFQEPMTSLNPVMKVGRQIEEAVHMHEKVSKQEAKQRTLEILEDVGISEPEKRYGCYPHELSGGLRQRIMIAMAMICKPALLIADEPTTALDVTVEAQILRLMKKLCEGGTSILMISHNLGVIAQLCDYVYVMYAGRILEEAETFTLFEHPSHPYTRGLLSSVSSLRSDADVLETIPGVVPNLLHLPDGCSFSLRCEQCTERCLQELPALTEVGAGHLVRCHFPETTTHTG